MRKERYAPIDGYEGYSVSTLGAVKNRHGRVLRATRYKDGYEMVSLCKNGHARKFFVHRLVALAFIGNPEHKETVNHINGNKADNRAENLEWATQSENNSHAYRAGLATPHRNCGAKNGRAKLTESQAAEIRMLLRQGSKGIEIAVRFQVSPITISRLKRNKTFKHPRNE